MSRITKVCAATILAKDGIFDFLYLAVRVPATITLLPDLDLVDSQYWNIFLCSGCFNQSVVTRPLATFSGLETPCSTGVIW